MQVLYFALYRERAGRDQQCLELPPGATVATLLDAVRALHPNLAPPAVSIVAAVNAEYAEHHQPLAEGDQVALIPPVSGGAG